MKTGAYITLLVALLALALPSLAHADEEECTQKGGQWMGEKHGRGRASGCAMPVEDAGRKCSDGAECTSGFCIVKKDEDEDTGPRDCGSSGECYGFNSPPKGCHAFFEHGKCEAKCVD
jgi:hypothetical protein